jgi:putative endonuclease
VIGWVYRAADALRRRALKDNRGRIGEDMAHRYLRGQGCTVVARNYRPPHGGGELDLVAWHGAVLAFVEVKTRTSVDHGSPDRAVDRQKQEFVERAARDYARRARVDWESTRFDIVAVTLGNPPRIEWLQNAWR